MYFYVSLHPSKKWLFSRNSIKKIYKNDTYLIKSQYIKSYTCQRPSSTKTRIKTLINLVYYGIANRHRPSSTITRIKTSEDNKLPHRTSESQTIFH